MKKREFVKMFFAGVFFLVGISLTLVIVFVVGKNKGFTQPKFHVVVLFKDVGGLIEGAPVQLAGVNVGIVSDISFLEKEFQGRRVNVRLSIFNKYRMQLAQKMRFAIKTEGILGEKLVEIKAGDGGYLSDSDQPIIGEDSIDVQDLAEVFSDAAESFTRTSEDFNSVDIQELSRVLAETARSLSTTSKGVSTILTEMYYISIKSKRLLDRLEQGVIDGNLFKVF